MTNEQRPIMPKFDEDAYAWDIFRYWTASTDLERFRQTYLGHYASRTAVGEELMHNLGVDRRLQKIPGWLRPYVRFDAEAVVADFERDGHFFIYDASYDGGTYVFDTYALGETHSEEQAKKD